MRKLKKTKKQMSMRKKNKAVGGKVIGREGKQARPIVVSLKFPIWPFKPRASPQIKRFILLFEPVLKLDYMTIAWSLSIEEWFYFLFHVMRFIFYLWTYEFSNHQKNSILKGKQRVGFEPPYGPMTRGRQ